MKRPLKWLVMTVAALVALLAVLALYVELAWNKSDSRIALKMTAPHDSATIARGEYIFRHSWQCWGCHAANSDGNALPSGGRAFDLSSVGPGFGLYYSRNLTPDSATGLGAWTDGEIVQAIRE